MISSIVWLYLLDIGKINPDHAPWRIYIPVVILEVFIYTKILPKICDKLERRKKK